MHRLSAGRLAVLAVAVRITAALTLVVVAQDGARNLRMSRLILEGRWLDALTLYPITHPLYPMMVAIGEALTGTPLFCACAISAVLGGLAVVPLHHLARSAWNERVAGLAGLLYAFLPAAVELHGDAMLEGAFFFFFLSSMALVDSALEKASWPRAALSGVAAAAAWLTRPEGAYLVPLILLACLLRRGRFALPAAALALVPAAVLALPYQGFIKAQTGRYGVSASPFSAGILGLFSGKTAVTGYQVDAKSAEEFGEYRDIARFGPVGGPLVSVGRALLKNLYYLPALAVLLGFARLRTQDPKPRPVLYLLAGAGGYLLPACLAFLAGTPFSHRYILLTTVLLLPVGALGFLALESRPRVLAGLLVALCAVMAVRDVRLKRADKLPLKTAGTAIRERLGKDRRILAMSRQLEYYARGEYVEFLPGATFEDVKKLVDAGKVDVIAADLDDFRNVAPGLRDRLDAAYPLMEQFSSGKTVVRVWLAAKPR
jgi:4-amino-4-deoxy-L-arabinose transferase-like glycosyltransferase